MISFKWFFIFLFSIFLNHLENDIYVVRESCQNLVVKISFRIFLDFLFLVLFLTQPWYLFFRFLHFYHGFLLIWVGYTIETIIHISSKNQKEYMKSYLFERQNLILGCDIYISIVLKCLLHVRLTFKVYIFI